MKKNQVTPQRLFSFVIVPEKKSRYFVMSIVDESGEVSFDNPTKEEKEEYKRNKNQFLEEIVPGENGLQLIRLHQRAGYQSPFASRI